MIRRVTGRIFPALVAALMFTASTAAAQHQHDDSQHEQKESPIADAAAMDVDGHQMMDGAPHFMTAGDHIDAVKQVLSGYAAAAAQSSVDAMAAYVVQSDDFTIVEGSHPNWGWTDYRDNHLKPEVLCL